MTTWLHVSTPVSRLRNSQELRAAGRSAAELRRAGVAVAELRPFCLEMLKSIGVSDRELRTLEILDWCMGLGKRQRERERCGIKSHEKLCYYDSAREFQEFWRCERLLIAFE